MTARPSPVLIAPLDPERIAADWPKARAALAERGHVEPEILQVLADQIEPRRAGCQVLLAIEIGSVFAGRSPRNEPWKYAHASVAPECSMSKTQKSSPSRSACAV